MKLVLNIDTEKQPFPSVCPLARYDLGRGRGQCNVKAQDCMGLLAERPDWCPLEVVEPPPPVKEFTSRAPYFGERNHRLQCFYCGLEDDKVEAGGVWYCPNPLCTGPGVTNWFASKLKSYRDMGSSGGTASEEEIVQEANKYLNEHKELRAKVEKLFQRKDNHNEV